MAVWNILCGFGIFYDHFEHFVLIWYIFFGFGIVYQEKSGNPAADLRNEYSFAFWDGQHSAPMIEWERRIGDFNN
jgi:hypothetical protein